MTETVHRIFAPPAEAASDLEQANTDAVRSQVRYLVAVRPIEFFRQSEIIDPAHVQELASRIAALGLWTSALPVEAGSGYVMDGNHRLAAARLLGLRRLPCIPLQYGDKRIDVRCWASGRGYSYSELMGFVESEQLLPYKTTRHAFMPNLPETEISVGLLR
ncbi:ParB N-terminal domain-containing protein [Roseateles sp. DB2]|uniref:ParB N-terminal domain-containing protein n=1 Tax=Roseateles sp. DB2 TaxID=3453717 RepID=UPI003EEFBD3A